MMEVTAPAMSKLKEVLEEQGEKDAALRVIAVPSDQGGVQYMMTMEKEVQKDDTILDMDGIRL
jgi:iron-sulfur cluster insertion protein